MEVISAKVDAATKRRMEKFRDINWSAIIRDAIHRRLGLEERLRTPIDRRRALESARRIDEFRKSIGPSDFDSTREIRKWRDAKPPRS